METDINDSNSTRIGVKSESAAYATLFPKLQSCYGYSRIEIDHENEECSVNIKKEEHDDASVPVTAITLDAVDVAENVSNIGIEVVDFKVKSDGDGNDLLKFTCKKEPGDDDASEIGNETKKCNECKQNLCDIYAENRKMNGVSKHTTISANERCKCETCPHRFKTDFALKLHIEGITQIEHAGIFETKDFVCYEELSSETHATKQTHKCEICDKRFTTRLNLSRHVKTHAEKTHYKCEICDKCFTTKRYLPEHAKTHTGERNHECALCGKRFTTKLNLSRHVKTHAGERNHRCELCGKRFTKKLNLSRHTKTHTGERNYKCETCEKRFATNWDLSQHVKTHTKEKDYKCDVCEKRFARKQHLTQHVVTHTRERNYKCGVCDSSFSRKQYLLMHVETHAGERNKCEICDKCFTTRQNLAEHVKIHGGERNYECGLCDKRFKRKHHLSRHVAAHGGRYKCEICDRRFEKRRAFLKHVKTHDEDETLQNLSYVSTTTTATDEINEIDKPFIKKDAGTFLMKDKFEINGDIAERKPSTATNESRFITAVKEEDPKSEKILNLSQALDSEITIKEEHATDASTEETIYWVGN